MLKELAAAKADVSRLQGESTLGQQAQKELEAARMALGHAEARASAAIADARSGSSGLESQLANLAAERDHLTEQVLSHAMMSALHHYGIVKH